MCISPVFEGDVGEDDTKKSHRCVDDRHSERQRPGDGLTDRNTKVDRGGVVLQSAAP